MQVLMDGQLIEVKAASLAAGLEAGRAAAARSNRVLVEALLDGVRIPDAVLENPRLAGPGGAELRFASADPRSLVVSTLRDAAAALQDAPTQLSQAADLIDTGQFDPGMSQLSSVLGSWEQSRQAVVNGMALLRIRLDDVRISLDDSTQPGRPLAEWVASLAAPLAEVKRSISARDWVGLTDALRYDLSEQASAWGGMLTRLADDLATPT